MAQDRFKTPPNPKMAHENQKSTPKSWLGSCWDNLSSVDFHTHTGECVDTGYGSNLGQELTSSPQHGKMGV